MNASNIGKLLKADLLNPYTRAKAAGQIADAVRSSGGRYMDAVKLIQSLHEEARLPIPRIEDIDWWFAESEEEEP